MARSPAAPPSPAQSPLLRYYLRGFAEVGVDAKAVRARLKIDEPNPPRPARGFLHAIWETASEVSGESGIGIRLAERSRVEDWDLLGGMISSSATLGNGMIAMTRMVPLVTTAVRVSFHVEADRCTWALDPTQHDIVHPEHVEFLVTSAILAARHSIDEPLPLDEVFFAHGPPADLAHHRRVFGITPTFHAPGNGCSFDSRFLARPLRTRDDQAHATYSRRVEQLLAKSGGSDDLRRRVREALTIELVHGEPTSERIAARLDMHPKSLSRGLSALGTSFREVRDSLRYTLAVRYLRRARYSVEDIAMRLGYSDASAFHRAFRRWSGRSPLDFRGAVPKRSPDDTNG